MLQALLSQLLGDTLYIQIWAHRIRVVNVSRGLIFDGPPLLAHNNNAEPHRGEPTRSQHNPFSHPRTLLSDFTGAETLLQGIYRSLCGARCHLLRPRAIIQPMEKLEGGLTTIERRALTELALGAGAWRALVYTGPALQEDPASLNTVFKEQH